MQAARVVAGGAASVRGEVGNAGSPFLSTDRHRETFSSPSLSLSVSSLSLLSPSLSLSATPFVPPERSAATQLATLPR